MCYNTYHRRQVLAEWRRSSAGQSARFTSVRSWVRSPSPPPKQKEPFGSFLFCGGIEWGIERPCLCRYDRQKHSGGVFLGRSDAVTNIMRCRNDRARQNAFWRNRDSITSPATSTRKKSRQALFCLVEVYAGNRWPVPMSVRQAKTLRRSVFRA